MGTALLFTLAALCAAAPSAGSVEPCALLTRAEVAAALGAAAGPGSPDKARGCNRCQWTSPDEQKIAFVTIVQAWDFQLARTGGGKLVHGIGEEAVWATGSLFIRKGSAFVQVGLYLGDTSMKAMDPEILELGKAAAGRM